MIDFVLKNKSIFPVIGAIIFVKINIKIFNFDFIPALNDNRRPVRKRKATFPAVNGVPGMGKYFRIDNDLTIKKNKKSQRLKAGRANLRMRDRFAAIITPPADAT